MLSPHSYFAWSVAENVHFSDQRNGKTTRSDATRRILNYPSHLWVDMVFGIYTSSHEMYDGGGEMIKRMVVVGDKDDVYVRGLWIGSTYRHSHVKLKSLKETPDTPLFFLRTYYFSLSNVF